MKLSGLFSLPRKASVVRETEVKPPKDWHVLFQNLRYLGKDKTPGGSWSARADLGQDRSGERHYIDLLILADEDGPTHGQVVFYQWIIHNPSEVFEFIRNRVVPAWEIKTGERFPDDWRTEFSLSAIRIPRYGDKFRPWTITFKLKSLKGKRMDVVLNKGVAIDVAFEYLGCFNYQSAKTPYRKLRRPNPQTANRQAQGFAPPPRPDSSI